MDRRHRVLDETVILEHVTTKRHRNEGYNLCREERVKSLSSNKVGKYIYFRSVWAPKKETKYVHSVSLF